MRLPSEIKPIRRIHQSPQNYRFRIKFKRYRAPNMLILYGTTGANITPVAYFKLQETPTNPRSFWKPDIKIGIGSCQTAKCYWCLIWNAWPLVCAHFVGKIRLAVRYPLVCQTTRFADNKVLEIFKIPRRLSWYFENYAFVQANRRMEASKAPKRSSWSPEITREAF